MHDSGQSAAFFCSAMSAAGRSLHYGRDDKCSFVASSGKECECFAAEAAYFCMSRFPLR